MKPTMIFPTSPLCTTRLPLRERSERFGGDGRAQGAARARPRGGSPLLLPLFALTLFAPFALSACDSTTPNPTGAGGGGGAGGTPVGCVPSENAGPVGDECGVFVSSSMGDDINGGTKEKPFKTIGAALTAANGKPVYACADAFTEAVVVTAPVDLYGGLDCSNGWAYVGAAAKTTLTAAADAVPLVVQAGASGSRVEDFAVIAVDAVTPGGSSIAMIAQDGATAELLRCELRAGAGAPGAAGTTPMAVGPNGEGQNGENGTPGTVSNPVCTSTVAIVGGDGGLLTCDRVDVSGGPGGNGTKGNAGGDANDGQPQPGPMPLDGQGGKGQNAADQCDSGEDGAQGMFGTSGPGATGIGNITADGYTAANATPGLSAGTPGQGGGGGGGAKACDMMNMFAGPSGGGGGSGGCGGAPGLGGGAGGSSIGLLSHQAAVTLTSVSIVTALGGTGGLGGNGQPGGGGGQPGTGGAAGACTGGQGGSGGRGGSGGGGLGGHSIGIASKGTAPVQNDVTIVQGAHGPGGLGGDGDATVQGADGQECKTLSFDEPGSCS